MYAGEMCYWHKQLQDTINASNPSDTTHSQSDADNTDATGQRSTSEGSTTQPDQSSSQNISSRTVSCATQTTDLCDSNFDSQKLGMQFLQRFVDVVKGPLKSSGWDCSKAEDILKALQK